MIYLDSCALVKLVLPEKETDALSAYLADHHTDRHVTCDLALTEVPRAAIRVGADDEETFQAVDELLDRVLRLRLTRTLLRGAGRGPGSQLRSLDAIHLTAAGRLGPALSAFVTYDHRLADAAAAADLPVCAPA